jgi:hypothetical protein
MSNFQYVCGVITDGFALCEDLRFYLQKLIQDNLISLRVSQAANKVFINSPKFDNDCQPYVCLDWDNSKQKISFKWQNDKGEIKQFATLPELVTDIKISIKHN